MSRVIHWLRRLLGLCVYPGCTHNPGAVLLNEKNKYLQISHENVGGGRWWVDAPNPPGVRELSWKCGKFKIRDIHFPGGLPAVSFEPVDSEVAAVLNG